MSLAISYENLPIDLSGSISKNRHRNEMLWGLTQIFDLYKSGKDFAVIFDNKCDIEIVSDNLISFYQIKTSDENYTINKLIKIPKKKLQSILSTLYSLNNKSTKSLYIVSNCNLSISDNKTSKQELISFNDLSADEKETIKEHIKKQLAIEIDFNKVFFWRSEFCVTNPGTLLLGRTVIFLGDIFKEPSVRAESFFNYMQSLILGKACYENACNSLEDAIKYKGITRNEFQNILNSYQLTNNSRQQKIERYFEKIYPTILERVKLKQAYIRLSKLENRLIFEQSIKQVSNFIKDNPKVLENTEKDAVVLIAKSVSFDDWLDMIDKECIAIIALIELEESIA